MAKMRFHMHVLGAHSRSGGGSLAMQRLARALRAEGHTVAVSAIDRSSGQGDLNTEQFTRKSMQLGDILLTTGSSLTRNVRELAVELRKPVVTFVHSALNADPWTDSQLVVWGSAAMQARVRSAATGPPAGWKGEEIVMWPLIWPDRVRTHPGAHITLCNLSPLKGSDLFYTVASRMPHLPFLAVKGGWGAQSFDPFNSPNVRRAEYQEDPRNIYAQTKLLLFMKGPNNGPDWLQGIGMVALEAQCSGIPVIAHEGPGLIESLGQGQGTLWTTSHEPLAWISLINHAYENYTDLSLKAYRRAHRILQPEADLRSLLTKMEDLYDARR